MNHTEFEKRLNDAVENRLPADSAEFRELIAADDAAREQWQTHLLLEQATHAWKNEIPDVDLTDAVVDALRVEGCLLQGPQRPSAVNSATTIPATHPENGRIIRRSGRAGAVVVAAGIALVICVVPLFRPAGSNRTLVSLPLDSTARPASVTPATSVATTEDPASADLETLFADAGSAYWGLARNAAVAVNNVSVLMPPSNNSAIPLPAEKPSGSWLKQWGNSLQPIGSDVGKAIDFLIDAVPLDTESTTS